VLFPRFFREPAVTSGSQVRDSPAGVTPWAAY